MLCLVSACVCMHACTYLCVCMQVCIYVYVSMNMNLRMHVSMWEYVYVYACIDVGVIVSADTAFLTFTTFMWPVPDLTWFSSPFHSSPFVLFHTTFVCQVGKLSLVDLAGSERAANTKNTGARLIEGSSSSGWDHRGMTWSENRTSKAWM